MVLVSSLVAGITILVIAVLLFPGALRLNRVKYISQLLAFPVLLVILGALAAIISGALWRLTAARIWQFETFLFIVYVLGAILQLRRLGVKNSTETAAKTQDELVILGWNNLGDSVPLTYMRDVILREQPDAVGLPETTESYVTELAAMLTAAGYPMRGYNVGPKDGHDPHETSLLVKATYGAYTIERLNILGASTLKATPVEVGAPNFVAVHTVAPRFDLHYAWVKDLRMLSQTFGQAKRTVLVGDFNATALHMRGLSNTPGVLGGLKDAATQQQVAAYGTWPADKPAVLGTQIDHVLCTPDYEVTGFRVLSEHDGAGSDHRAIRATLKPVD